MSYQGCVTLGHTGSTEAGRRKKATAKTADDVDELPTSYNYLAEHWVHLRTTNPG